MEIVIGSHNVHKIREFREMFKGFRNFDVLSLLNFPQYVPPPETETTFKGNAILKAEHAAHQLNKWVIADDSGLVVPSLDGRPGVFSRRYAGEDATDAENRNKLLSELSGKKEFERAAYFDCCIALAKPGFATQCVTGTCEGLILEEGRGRNGFGYDPLFVKHEYDKTFAELDEVTKNRISHRRKAFDKLIIMIESLNLK